MRRKKHPPKKLQIQKMRIFNEEKHSRPSPKRQLKKNMHQIPLLATWLQKEKKVGRKQRRVTNYSLNKNDFFDQHNETTGYNL